MIFFLTTPNCRDSPCRKTIASILKFHRVRSFRRGYHAWKRHQILSVFCHFFFFRRRNINCQSYPVQKSWVYSPVIWQTLHAQEELILLQISSNSAKYRKGYSLFFMGSGNKGGMKLHFLPKLGHSFKLQVKSDYEELALLWNAKVQSKPNLVVSMQSRPIEINGLNLSWLI